MESSPIPKIPGLETKWMQGDPKNLKEAQAYLDGLTKLERDAIKKAADLDRRMSELKKIADNAEPIGPNKLPPAYHKAEKERRVLYEQWIQTNRVIQKMRDYVPWARAMVKQMSEKEAGKRRKMSKSELATELAMAATATERALLLARFEADNSYTPPEGAQNNAKKVLAWKDEHGDEVNGMTSVGWGRARQLASGKPISRDTVSRMAQFNRHRKNAEVDPKHKDEPWKDAGYVAWLGWGGTTGIEWAMGIMESEKR